MRAALGNGALAFGQAWQAGELGEGDGKRGASKKQSLSGPEKNPDLLCNDACLEQPLKQALKQEKK